MESLCNLVLETHGYQHPIPVDSETHHSHRTSQAHARVFLRERTMEDELTLIHKSFLLTQSVPICPGACRTNAIRFLTTFRPNCSPQQPSHSSPERTLHPGMDPSPVPVKAAFVRQYENQATGLWRWQGCHQPLRSIYQWPPASSHHRMHLPVHTRFIKKW